MINKVLISLGLLALASIVLETPSQPDLPLVESLLHVERILLSDIDPSIDESTVNPHGFAVLRVRDYEFSHGPNLAKNVVPLVVFITYGSHGHYYQVPSLLNALQNHTLYLSQLSTTSDYVLMPFVFDFREMPTAFS
jgi:hypothetical protein